MLVIDIEKEIFLILFILFQPLNSAPDSSWAVYFKENEVLLQIDKDVRLVSNK
jgi:hypothetical protein